MSAWSSITVLAATVKTINKEWETNKANLGQDDSCKSGVIKHGDIAVKVSKKCRSHEGVADVEYLVQFRQDISTIEGAWKNTTYPTFILVFTATFNMVGISWTCCPIISIVTINKRIMTQKTSATAWAMLPLTMIAIIIEIIITTIAIERNN